MVWGQVMCFTCYFVGWVVGIYSSSHVTLRLHVIFLIAANHRVCNFSSGSGGGVYIIDAASVMETDMWC